MAQYYVNAKPTRPRRVDHLFTIFTLLMAGAIIGIVVAFQYINYEITQGIPVAVQQ